MTSRRLDMTKVDAAFQRAAHKALHGTREERSGRFLLKQKPQSTHAASRGERKAAAKEKA